MRPLRYLPPIRFHYLFLNFTPIIIYDNYLFPTICNIISYSLNSGTVPSIFKQAIITPILKKLSLDPESLLNYCTISQLPGKIC